eukprot:TRINITY_DN24720_c0_g1_i1.p1 TRINITY_DN24720_c0_g1~~TRINITY_DN24720_c0_g1_i1.p1  ORF type:complete len:366 (+),score=134.48 TRINITY_DN24720_c0_g1_i1:75-1172(+)
MATAGVDASAVEAVLVPCDEIPEGDTVTGPDVTQGLGVTLDAYRTTGYQATNLGNAIEEVNAMLRWRMFDDKPALNAVRQSKDMSDEEAKAYRVKVFLGVTSALMLSGVREAVAWLCKHGMVQTVVTPGGGLDWDIARTLVPQHITVGEYNNGEGMRHGNVQVDSCVKDVVVGFVDAVLCEMVKGGETVFTPSEIIRAMGRRLQGEERGETSVLGWCEKNAIPIYSPSIVDGYCGDAIFAFNKKRKAAGEAPVRVDLVEDVKGMNKEAMRSNRTGMIILGGGLVKHHICNANLMRNGANHSVFIGTGQEFDGSDAGARPDEAISWGKIRPGTKPIKIYTDANVAFPLLVAKAFFPYYQANKDLYP